MSRENQVEVVRVPSFTAPRSRLLPRLWESFSFGRQAVRYLEARLPDTDVVYANSWPLLSQAHVARWCARRNVPLVLHIQDVYPESLLTRLPGLLAAIARPPLTALDRWTTQHAARLIVIGDSMYRTYVDVRGVSREKVVTVFNWQDEARFVDVPSRAAVCVNHGIRPDRFTFMYLGNIGPVAGVELLIQAFARSSLPKAQLVIAGDGSNKQACVALVERLGCTAVRFIPCLTPFDAPILLQMADVCLLPMRAGTGVSSIPSKLAAYLLSAKPVLATLDSGSETARCIRQAQCGWIGQPDLERRLAEKMAEVSAVPTETLRTIGERGREYALRHFSKAQGVARLAAVIEEAAEMTAQRPLSPTTA